MRIDWFVTYAYGVAEPVEEREVFKLGTLPRVLVLVETTDELHLVDALQFIHGAQVDPTLWDKTDITDLRTRHPRIYTTWDPWDPNRI